MMRFLARRYDTAQLVTLAVADGRIQSLAEFHEDPGSHPAPWVAPGWIDIQVNGHGGREFSRATLTEEDVAAITGAMDAQGVTRYCPTLTTHAKDVLVHALRTLAAACEHWPPLAARLAGIHLEGPYICPDDGPRGAHPRQHVRPPDWEEFQSLQEAAQGRIRILTLSPEYDQASTFIQRVARSGVLVAIGHTNADSDQIRAAVDAGARLSTHLGNGSHGTLRRHPNYIWDQLAEDRLWASLIVDGHHLPPSVVKTFLRAKSPERCLLVSDITSLAGLPPGLYQSGGLGAVEMLPNGRLIIAGQHQLLAGASLPIAAGIANVVRCTEYGLKTAVDMASLHPAQLLDLPPGRLAPGEVADLVLFSLPGADGRGPLGEISVQATLKSGQCLWGRLPDGT